MALNTVIFDMDGLLIDSEPLWNEAATEIFRRYNINLTPQQYATTTGLRTKEFIQWWFAYFKMPITDTSFIERGIIEKVIELVIQKGKPMAGLAHIFNFFIERKFKLGLASSSPMDLINVIIDQLQIRNHLHAITSAAKLQYGKPHPAVYLDCAAELGSTPVECLCFEDSFPGLIAVKAAGMKCVVVPDAARNKDLRWHAADLKISSLQNFNDLLMYALLP
jgi:beta-phosphoglucomutase-like phosphatase (HAD superfamily)